MTPSDLPDNEDVDVLLYGATGYTGRLIADELDRCHKTERLTFALAGRDKKRLEAVSASLSAAPTTITVGLDDPEGLERAARRARVVLSAAGPFRTMGPPVMEAALRAGSHFVDITGEQAFLRWAYEQDAKAQDAGVTVVNALGFDVVPSDIAALVSTTAMQDVQSIDICIATNAALSGGTRRSMAQAGGRSWWYDRGRYRRGPPGRFLRPFRFPEPLGERTAVFVPWGDVVTAPRSTGAKTVRTFFSTKSKTAKRIHRLWPVTHFVSRLPTVRRAMAERAPPPGQGPSREERAKGRFTILAEATDADGLVQRGLTQGRDPYGLTAAAAVHGAAILARHDAPRGVLTPTQAFTFGPFSEALKPYGFEWRVRSVNE